jgi:superoxide reductase
LTRAAAPLPAVLIAVARTSTNLEESGSGTELHISKQSPPPAGESGRRRVVRYAGQQTAKRRPLTREASMNRRNFILLGTVGAGGTLVVPRAILAADAGGTPPMAGGVYLTQEAPGRWSKKVSSHLPNIEIEKTDQSTSLRIETRHLIEGYNHYIVKHMLLDRDFAFMDEHMFDPIKEKRAISTFSLQDYSGPVYVLSVCNIHDTWMNTAQV